MAVRGSGIFAHAHKETKVPMTYVGRKPETISAIRHNSESYPVADMGKHYQVRKEVAASDV